MTKLLQALLLIFMPVCSIGQIVNTPIAGKQVASAPWFQFINNFQPDDTVHLAIDPFQLPNLIGQSIDVFICTARTPDQYQINPALVDVRGASQAITVSGSGIQSNIIALTGSAALLYQQGHRLGVGYDIVLDVDNSGTLSNGDIIDGWFENEAGFYKVHDSNIPGPLPVSSASYIDTDPWLDKMIFYPTDMSVLDPMPIVVVSHGWTYDHFMYDYIGEHLASYGYVVIIHANDVGNGGPAATHSASLTTLNNIDHFIGAQSTLLGGIFNGNIDPDRIAFLGHSTGGEGIVRAYSRLVNNEYFPNNFTVDDVQLLCPLAPTAWLTASDVDPGAVPFHLFHGGADADCSLAAAAESGWQQSFSIFERSTGPRQLTYIHGVGHTDLTDCISCNQFIDLTAPNLIGKQNTHKVVRSYLLPLVEYYLRGNMAGKEYFSRMYDDLHPISIPDNIVISKEYKEAQAANKLVIDDFQSNNSTSISSSGTTVSFNMNVLQEIDMRDNDGSFAWTGTQAANGFSRSKIGDTPRCAVMDHANTDAFYSVDIPLSPLQYEFLSFRLCQGTRHPNTLALDSGLVFSVSLIDDLGTSSTISIANYGSINSTYARSGGWANEFESVLLRLSDFKTSTPNLDLDQLTNVRFDLGPSWGSSTFRIALDDIELIGERETFTSVLTADVLSGSAPTSISVYPNPSDGQLTVTGIPQHATITITDLLGRKLRQLHVHRTIVRLSLHDLAPGTYMLGCDDGQNASVQSFILQ